MFVWVCVCGVYVCVVHMFVWVCVCGVYVCVVLMFVWVCVCGVYVCHPYVCVHVCDVCVVHMFVCLYAGVCGDVWCGVCGMTCHYVHRSIRLENQLLQEKKATKTREAELVKEGVVKDAQILALQEVVSRLQLHLHSRDADVEKCVKYLSNGSHSI